MFYLVLKHSHSVLRWVFLLVFLFTLVRAFTATLGKKDYTPLHKRTTLLSLILSHLQFILGFILFLVSPKVIFSAASMSNRMLRFFLVEHTVLMLMAIVLITVGYSRTKIADEATIKHRRTLVYYGIALFIILVSIPWPWRPLAAGWF